MILVDTEGMKCPDPIRVLHFHLNRASPGDTLAMMATDPSTLRDVRRLCQFLQHELAGTYVVRDGYRLSYYFLIIKGGPAS